VRSRSWHERVGGCRGRRRQATCGCFSDPSRVFNCMKVAKKGELPALGGHYRRRDFVRVGIPRSGCRYWSFTVVKREYESCGEKVSSFGDLGGR